MVAEKSCGFRKCDRDDAHYNKVRGPLEAVRPLSKTEEDAMDWEPKYAKRDSDPKHRHLFNKSRPLVNL